MRKLCDHYNVRKILLLKKNLLILFLLAGLSATCITSVQAGSRREWLTEVGQILPSAYFTVTSTAEEVLIPPQLLNYRIVQSVKDPRIEGVSLKLPRSEEKLKNLVTRIALPRNQERLLNLMTEYLRGQSSSAPGDDNPVLLRVDQTIAELLTPEAFVPHEHAMHHRPILATERLRDDETLRRSLLTQVSPYLSSRQRHELESAIIRSETIAVDPYLLPSFARQVLGKFSIYQGLNCFHAALAFQSPVFSHSPFYNFNREKDHHRLMINSDELWRALESDFYPLRGERPRVNYGDILVYFDLPEEGRSTAISYRWIRHASTYLLANYTFSKGSKSSYTPYVIKRLEDEWAHWQKKSKNLGVKIFRRKGNDDEGKGPAASRKDWLY